MSDLRDTLQVAPLLVATEVHVDRCAGVVEVKDDADPAVWQAHLVINLDPYRNVINGRGV